MFYYSSKRDAEKVIGTVLT